jgi:hypothetical protein
MQWNSEGLPLSICKCPPQFHMTAPGIQDTKSESGEDSQ